jgi:hypothetical protein
MVIKILLLILLVVVVIRVVYQLWRGARREMKYRKTFDERIDADIDQSGSWGILWWGDLFGFILEPRVVVLIGVALGIWTGFIYHDEHRFAMQSSLAVAEMTDLSTTHLAGDSRYHQVRFKTTSGKVIETEAKITSRLPFDAKTFQLVYSNRDPTDVKCPDELYDATKGGTVLALIILVIGGLRWYWSRPRPPVSDWRNEI